MHFCVTFNLSSTDYTIVNVNTQKDNKSMKNFQFYSSSANSKLMFDFINNNLQFISRKYNDSSKWFHVILWAPLFYPTISLMCHGIAETQLRNL